jgi:hypothetical protein
VDVFGGANVAHAKSAKPRRIGGGSGWSRLMKACHDHDVALTVIFNEFASDIALNGADCRGLPGTLDLQARTGAEFWNSEDGQTSDPSSENAFLRHDFLPKTGGIEQSCMAAAAVGG